MAAHALWRMLISDEGAMDEGLLRLAWRKALESGDRDVLAILAGRRDLPEEVERAARAHRWAEVRGAWLGRSGQDAAVLLEAVARERATSALVVAAHTATDPTVLRALASRTGKVFDAELATLPTLPTDVALDVFVRVSNHYASPRKVVSRRQGLLIVKNLQSRADTHDGFALRVTATAWMPLVASSDILSVDAQERLLELGVADPFAAGQWRVGFQVMHAMLRSDASDSGVIRRLKALADAAPTECLGHAPTAAAFSRTRNPRKAISAARLATAAAALDAAVLRDLADQAVAATDHALATAVFRNPAAGLDSVSRVARLLDAGDIREQLELRVHRDDALLEALVEGNPELISQMGLPASARTHLAKHLFSCLTAGTVAPGRRAWQAVARFGELELDELLEIPYLALSAASKDARGAVSLWVGEQLGHTPEAFDALDVLADGFDGSMRQLVETSRLLT